MAGGIDVDHQPDDDYFDLMADVAGNHWWYRARRTWITGALEGKLPVGATVVDVGTGTAETLDAVASLGARRAVGTDLSMTALRHARRRQPAPTVLQALAEHLPFTSGVADAVISLDVIEHLDDDRAGLLEYRRLLRPGGVLVVTVPAYAWMWSEHDLRAAHRRRYTRGRLLDAITSCGLEPMSSTYLFSFLVPPAWLVRRTPVRHLVRATDDEVSSMHPAVDGALAGLAKTERWLATRCHVRVPFGLSVLCIARRPSD